MQSQILPTFDIPILKNGSRIHIKKKNREKFTEYCDGKVTQKCIDKAKKSGNKTLVKRATFAENSRAWKHADGGEIKLISKHQKGTSNGGIKQDNTRVVKQQEEDAELERILTTLQNSPKEQGLSAADPLLTPIVEGIILGKPLQWLRKGVLWGLGKAGNNWARAKLISKEMNVTNQAFAPSVKNAITTETPKGQKKPAITWEKAQNIVNNNVSPHRSIGTATPHAEQRISVESPLIGNYMDKGSQQVVFNSVNNPDKVMKVYTERQFTSIPEIKQFHEEFFKRNRLPIQERIEYQGYLQGNGRLYPVYSQNRVNPIGDMPAIVWEKEILPKIDTQMKTIGFNGHGVYNNGKLTVGDINPWNVGYDKNNKLRLFDADVYKLGGRIVR